MYCNTSGFRLREVKTSNYKDSEKCANSTFMYCFFIFQYVGEISIPTLLFLVEVIGHQDKQ